MRSTLNMLTELQQRSSTLLVALLGKSYSIEDVMFYAAGLLAALASASLPPTRQARMPLLCLLAACLALERSIPSWMHGLLEADASGRVSACTLDTMLVQHVLVCAGGWEGSTSSLPEVHWRNWPRQI